MAISLSSVSSNHTIAPPRVIIYGPRGVGKTTFAASAPGAILLPIEDGLGSLTDVAAFPLLKTYADVCEAIGALANEAHEYQTVVVDSIDWLEPIIWAETCARHEWDSVESPGYGKGYVEADAVWREFLDGLLYLRAEKHMAVVLVAHEEIKQFAAPDTDPYDRYQIKLHKRGAALVEEWSDAILFANYKVHTTEADAGFNKKIRRGMSTGERLIYTEERPSHRAKNRYRLPYELPLSWPAFEAALASAPPAADAA